MRSFLHAAAVIALALLTSGCEPAETSTTSQNAAAQGEGFDFYVLALSWSPTYCLTEGANRQQCDSRRDYAFIAHGLWPQFERGYPEFCASNEPERVPNNLVATVADIMPSAGLVGHQWRKHGTCTGLSQADYLAAVRESFSRVAIPSQFRDAGSAGTTSPQIAEQAFITANAGMEPGGIAITCEAGQLSEARICLTKQLSFRTCPEVDARSCRASMLTLPAAP